MIILLLYYQFSQPHLYIFLQRVGRMYFLNLGVKGLKKRRTILHGWFFHLRRQSAVTRPRSTRGVRRHLHSISVCRSTRCLSCTCYSGSSYGGQTKRDKCLPWKSQHCVLIALASLARTLGIKKKPILGSVRHKKGPERDKFRLATRP